MAPRKGHFAQMKTSIYGLFFGKKRTTSHCIQTNQFPTLQLLGTYYVTWRIGKYAPVGQTEEQGTIHE
jgi:hypothetical protein